MGIPQNRTRMVYFRVSEDELLQLRGLCERVGARNMSDLARCAIELLIRRDGGNSFEQEVTERLRQMQQSLKEIREAINLEEA